MNLALNMMINDKMTPQEMAAKEVEVAGWLKSKGYDRRTWQGMASIIVKYLDESQRNEEPTDSKYVFVAKRNYLSKDGTIKEGVKIGDYYYAPRNDI